MTSVPHTPAAARFLAQLGQSAREIVRQHVEIPSDESLLAAWNDPPDNRAHRRAVRAVERRSARPKAPPSDDTQLAARAARERSDDRRYREKLERRSKEWAPPPESKRVKMDAHGKPWRLIPQAIWNMAKDIVSDTSGAAWRYWSRQFRNKAALGAIRRAALIPWEGGNETRRSWADECARRIAALGLALVALAKHTDRKGRFCTIVRGIPLTALRWLLGYPVSRSIEGEEARERAAKLPHWNTLIGRHRGRDSKLERGTLGYLRALEVTGLIARTDQTYDDPAEWEVGREGFKMNRYWVTGDAPTTRSRKPELVQLNREGWRAIDERPQRWRPPNRVDVYGKNPGNRAPEPPS